MKKIICTLFTFHFSLLTLHAQPTLEWVKTYSNPSGMSSGVLGMAIDTLGNTYITGGINTVSENSNFITIKYNSTGDTDWIAIYNGPGSNSIDVATAVAVDKNGNVYVTGKSEQTGFLTDAYCTIKYNSTGVQQWVARYKYNPSGQDDPSDIAVDDSGNVYISGTSTGLGTTTDYCTIKYNSNGDSVWVKRFNGDGNENDNANSLFVDESRNVYVTGSSYGGYFPYPTLRACTVKYDPNGVLLWAKMLEGAYSSGAGKIALDTSVSDIYVCGVVGNPTDFLLIKYNSNGVQQWFKMYDGTAHGDDLARDLVVDNNHNVYVTGWAYFGSGSTREDYVTIKYTPSGDSVWVRRYNGTGNYNDQSIAIGSDKYSNVYITGISDGIGGKDFATIKYSNTGIEQWTMRYAGGGKGIAVDKLLNVFITGGGRNAADIITIKYSQVDAISPISQNLPSEFKLYQNFPNPFNPSTKIKFDLPNPYEGTQTVRLVIYDVLGRAITTLVDEQLKWGNFEISWDAFGYSSGIYFYSLIVNDKTIETKKMILNK